MWNSKETRNLRCLRGIRTIAGLRTLRLPEPQGNSGHVVTLSDQKASGNGAVHSSAHCDDNSLSTHRNMQSIARRNRGGIRLRFPARIDEKVFGLAQGFVILVLSLLQSFPVCAQLVDPALQFLNVLHEIPNGFSA